MRIQIDMPQLGESIVEGTIVEWHKKVGDTVAQDEELFTLTTDKVDTDVPAPKDGVLVEILAQEDETVGVGDPVAIIETDASAAKELPPPGSAAEAESPAPPPADDTPDAPSSSPAVEPAAETDAPGVPMSPVAKKMLAQANIESLDGLTGSGAQGRVLKKDVEAFLSNALKSDADVAATTRAVAESIRRENPSLDRLVSPRPMRSPASSSTAQIKAPPILTASFDAVTGPFSGKTREKAPDAAPRVAQQRPHRPSKFDLPIVRQSGRPATMHVEPGPDDRVEPMSRSRIAIATNLSRARRVAVNCSSVWEADVTDMIAARERLAPEFQRGGVHLTYTPFFLAAIASGLQHKPVLNAATDGENIIYRGHINVGIASAWRDGMVVPTISGVDTLSLLGLSRAVGDIRRRTAEGELRPADLGQATFTFTNSGILGARYGVPTLFPRQVGIVSVGTIAKRVVVGEDDSLRVRSMVEICLTFDHRVVDFNDADGFMKHLVDYLEKTDW